MQNPYDNHVYHEIASKLFAKQVIDSTWEAKQFFVVHPQPH